MKSNLKKFQLLALIILVGVEGCATNPELQEELDEIVGNDPLLDEPYLPLEKLEGFEAEEEEPADFELISEVTVGDQAILEGCWASLYSESGFLGRKLTIYNSMDLPTLDFANGPNWKGEVESLEVGPNAQVILYSEENFGDLEYQAVPGEKLAGFTDLPFITVESLRVMCIP